MVDLEYADTLASVRIAQRERVESRTHHHNLARAACDTSRQSILGKPAARRDKEPHRPLRGIGRRFVEVGPGFIIEDACGKCISENSAAFHLLVDGSMNGRSTRSQTWPRWSHLASSDSVIRRISFSRE
jgi:hypothetical protein